jgi:hypothetical protein
VYVVGAMLDFDIILRWASVYVVGAMLDFDIILR